MVSRLDHVYVGNANKAAEKQRDALRASYDAFRHKDHPVEDLRTLQTEIELLRQEKADSMLSIEDGIKKRKVLDDENKILEVESAALHGEVETVRIELHVEWEQKEALETQYKEPLRVFNDYRRRLRRMAIKRG